MTDRDDIVDSFFPFIAKIQKRVDEIEDQVYTTRTDDTKEFLLQIENSRQQVCQFVFPGHAHFQGPARWTYLLDLPSTRNMSRMDESTKVMKWNLLTLNRYLVLSNS